MNNITTFNRLKPINYEYYNSYLPNAFDESMTILQKVNHMIGYYNHVIEQMNQYGEGIDNNQRKMFQELKKALQEYQDFKNLIEQNLLPEYAENLLEKWYKDGKLAAIINNDVFNMKADKSAAIYRYLSDYPRLEGETDDTERCKRWIADSKPLETLYAKEDESMIISDTLLFNKNTHIDIRCEVIFSGMRNKKAIHIKNCEFLNVYIRRIRDVDSKAYSKGYHGWTNRDYIGLCLENLRECDVVVDEIWNFTVGHQSKCSEGRGHWLNRICVKRGINSLIYNELNSDGYLNGQMSWMNANYFYGFTSGYSGSEFNGDTQNKYTILQTLSNGNTYGGNTNIFDQMHFESHTVAPKNWVQIRLIKAVGYSFINYRHENTNPNETANFVEIDCSTQDPTKNYVTHPIDIVFKPQKVIGYAHTFKILNTENIRVPYSEIIKLDTKIYTLHQSDNLTGAYRYISDSYHTIKGYIRKNQTSSYTEEIATDYSSTEMLTDKDVNISGSYPLVLYAENLNVGDELLIDVVGISPASPTVKCYDANKNLITSERIDNIRTLAIDGNYVSSYSYYNKNSMYNDFKFTINSPAVKHVVIMISGKLNSFTVNSNNRGIVLKTSQDKLFNHKQILFSNIKPVKKEDGYFNYGDVVVNINKATGQEVAWQLKGAGWESLGTR